MEKVFKGWRVMYYPETIPTQGYEELGVFRTRKEAFGYLEKVFEFD